MHNGVEKEAAGRDRKLKPTGFDSLFIGDCLGVQVTCISTGGCAVRVLFVVGRSPRRSF